MSQCQGAGCPICGPGTHTAGRDIGADRLTAEICSWGALRALSRAEHRDFLRGHPARVADLPAARGTFWRARWNALVARSRLGSGCG